MKTFRETLNKMKENDLSVWQALIAAEVNSYGIESEKDFEIICSWCYDYIMNNNDETDVSKIVSRIIDGLNSGDLTIENLKNSDIVCDNFVESYDY